MTIDSNRKFDIIAIINELENLGIIEPGEIVEFKEKLKYQNSKKPDNNQSNIPNKPIELINPYGALEKTITKVYSDTIQNSRDIMHEIRKKGLLPEMIYITGDFAQYSVDNQEPVLNMSNNYHNRLLVNPNDKFQQIIDKDNYFSNNTDIIHAKTTTKYILSECGLQEFNKELSYFEIDTKEYYKTLNKTQRRLAETAYGRGRDFMSNMKMLREKEHIKKILFYVLNPEYVLLTLSNKEINTDNSISLSRFCVLDCVDGKLAFNAGSKLDVDLDKLYIRATPRTTDFRIGYLPTGTYKV